MLVEQDAMVSAFRAYCDQHTKTGRCWRHDGPIRNCGCDPGVFLDLDRVRERELKRARAYGRLLAMRKNKAFWEAFAKMCRSEGLKLPLA